MKAARRALFAALLIVGGCTPDPGSEGRVDPGRYDAFFLWAGVRAPAVLARARTIYLLDGEVRARDNSPFVPLRPVAPRVRHAEIWLTVRLERLDWQAPVYRRMVADLAKWERAGNRVTGLQLDFDARTRGLADYAAFLREVRRLLPARYRLSITGLMDWSAGGDPAALAALAGTVDEVVIQTYQGRRTISGYDRYLMGLRRLPMAYRIGLVEGGEWAPSIRPEDDPHFRGYVIFLLPDGRRADR